MKIQELVSELQQEVDEISIDELTLLMKSDNPPMVIDVRDKEELIANGKIKGAHPITKGVLECQIEGICQDDEMPIILYCRSGTRSLIAAASLKRMGYDNVKSLQGGFMAWKIAGLETEMCA